MESVDNTEDLILVDDPTAPIPEPTVRPLAPAHSDPAPPEVKKHRLPPAEEWHIITEDEMLAAADKALHESPYGILGKRDSGLIALASLFGRRVSENIRLRKSDVAFRDGMVYVKFQILKKAKAPRKACLNCGEANGSRKRFCGECGKSIESPGSWRPIVWEEAKTTDGKPPNREIGWPDSNPLVRYIRQWWELVPLGKFMFPPCEDRGEFAYESGTVDWEKHLQRRSVAGILERHFNGFKIWPHLLRDSRAEIMYDMCVKNDLDPDKQLQEFFFWSSAQLVAHYTRSGKAKRATTVAIRMQRFADSKAS